MHFASTVEIVNVLLDSVPESGRQDYIFMRNKVQQTPLHMASKDGEWKVVESLCSLAPELVLLKDKYNNTALHFVRDVKAASALVDSLPQSSRDDYMYMKNDKGMTPLHTVVAEDNIKIPIIKYYLNVVNCANELVCQKDFDMKTSLH